MNIAICAIAFNRLHSLRRLLSSLEEAAFDVPAKLYISVDKSDTSEVENFAKQYVWPHGEKEVILHTKNLGLKKHVMECGDLVQKHDAIIFLEDDIVVSPGFFLFSKAAVQEYSDNSKIAGISLYSFSVNYHSCQTFIPLKGESDVFLMQNAQSWGQVWMKKQWAEFKNWYNEHSDYFGEMTHLPKSICNWPQSSWLKYHTRYCIEENKYFVYPYTSYSTCFADEGVHMKNTTTQFQTPLDISIKTLFIFNPTIVYNTYFENTSLYDWLKIDKDNLCIDFYGDNENREKRRFWLSKLLLPYKVIKSFGLNLKPYELNIKFGIEGNDLFLYDTLVKEEHEYDKECRSRQFFYLFGTKFIDENIIDILNDNICNLHKEIASQNYNIKSLEKIIADLELKKRKYQKLFNYTIIMLSGLSLLLLYFCISI